MHTSLRILGLAKVIADLLPKMIKRQQRTSPDTDQLNTLSQKSGGADLVSDQVWNVRPQHPIVRRNAPSRSFYYGHSSLSNSEAHQHSFVAIRQGRCTVPEVSR